MGHAQRRFVSTATKLVSVPLSSLRSFPPKEALASRSSSFSPEAWAALQPPPPSALSALSHRIGLGAVLQIPELEQACTHPSVLPLFTRRHPNQKPPPANENLSTLGNALLGLFASEFVAASYPHLPTRVVKAAVSAYVGPNTCANVAKEVGAAPLLRWHRTPSTPLKPAVLHHDALSSIPRSLVALIYQRRSLSFARKFTHQFFLSREVDLRKMLKFRDPKVALAETVAKFGREKPISRLLKETGRFSNSPVFVVGVYSGTEELGEGFGSSLKMAEYRAAEDALHRTFPDVDGDIFTIGGEVEYTPGEIGTTEIRLGSAGRSSIISPSPLSIVSPESH
ncbi:ribonuclease III domain-containing protein [Multifurca ochricompacta]|uniref:Large ribosomal subunit protein mL44 n=1 Tax=Multifurca ochricompacta TaxID=376703 RepID=A0AAD4M0V8_9AGAM|nr:ribonuclease III domain-containing protein [Multifurca ochricompacta]